MTNVIVKPLITEKATLESEKRNRFAFKVDRKANKVEIKKAVERMYGVNVVSVNTLVYGGGKSSVKYTNRGVVLQPNNPWKKAIVTVADGETIDLFNNI
ncbi:MAG: 50S ribosomal protein L23 [Flavobacteriia bacterium]|nr:50S ribosomal protein L23 [Flavobacteriia bacterium]OJX37444.1 MAG: 50S ribosomal protein L23 [Flavobacteriia bacterium 40-80]